MTILTGKQLIAGTWQLGLNGHFQAYDPVLGQNIEPIMSFANQAQIEQTLSYAAQAAPILAQISLVKRARFLTTCADEILALGDDLLARGALETGYPKARIATERDRTVNQLHLFAKLVLAGDFLNIRINTAQPERAPLPRPDLRYINQAIGPVVVFGASNFPLAYSVAGGDTVSALAAGCPVIVKGHNSHPGTCELVAIALNNAVKKCQLPPGTFSMLLGDGNEIGEQLVCAPEIKAVGFTGSTQGGIALMKLAQNRAEPIPVFAEMGSTNPVVLLPKTLKKAFKTIAENFVTSFKAGTGQFCVSPGLLIAIEDESLTAFISQLRSLIKDVPAGVMLNQGIYQSYQKNLATRITHDNVEIIAQGQTALNSKGCFSQMTLLKTDASTFIGSAELKEEIFGHTALLITCKNINEIIAVIESLNGQLTGTIQGGVEELAEYGSLIQLLQQKVGRLVINNFPTGVEVCEAMMHGGPFPASSDSRFTSVGTASITRFLKPVCLQNYPEALLPEALQNNNPLNINRLVDGVYTRAAID